MVRGSRLLPGLVLVGLLSAGCLDAFAPPGAQPGDPCARLACDVFFAPAADVRADHAWGYARLKGPALVVPFQVNGTAVGGVVLGALLDWKADELFQAKIRENERRDEFVEPPAGAWPGIAQGLALKPASAAQLQRFGYASADAAVARARSFVPPNATAPTAGWTLNGTFAFRSDATGLTIATEEGPFVFHRNATNTLVIERSMVIAWDGVNRTLDVENDGVARVQPATEDAAGRLTARWTDLKLEAELGAPYFRASDVQFSEQDTGRLASATLPGYASLVFVKFVPPVTLQDGLVEFRNANVTLRMKS